MDQKPPLQLSRLFKTYNLKQVVLAQSLGISGTAVSLLKNYQMWPITIERDVLKARIAQVLRNEGVSEEEIKTAFDEETLEGQTKVEPPRGNEAAPVKQHATPKNPVKKEESDPMLLRRQSLAPATKRAFGLFRDPFDNDVQASEDVYSSPDIRYVREAMYQTAKHGGFMAITGESGAGKTTLRRDLIDRIGRQGEQILMIEPYVLGSDDGEYGKTLRAACISDCIIQSIAPLEKPKRGQDAKARQCHKMLAESRRAGYSHVLLIEEAHSVSITTLKHLKRFYELEDGFKKLLGIILIGQPELNDKLSERNPQIREVVQRCEIVNLPPLDACLEDYLNFKFKRIGNDLKNVFEPEAIDAVRAKLTFSRPGQRDRMSLLYPLAINNLVTASMNLAASIGAPKVTADIVKEA